mgnify:FL=1
MRKGSKATSETRIKLRVAATGRKHTLETRAKISAAHKGRIKSPETRAKMSAKIFTKKQRAAMRAGTIAHMMLDIECNCITHAHSKVSKLTWLLAEALVRAGFTVQPEANIGRRSIDVLLIDEWVAFEADGGYWHNLPGRHSQDKKRDKELLKIWNLPKVLWL